VVLEVGLTQPLWSVVQRSSDLSVKENAASALWTATQADVDQRQRVAELMGPLTFSQFLATAVTSVDKSTVSSELLVIGAEGIEVDRLYFERISHFTNRDQARSTENCTDVCRFLSSTLAMKNKTYWN